MANIRITLTLLLFSVSIAACHAQSSTLTNVGRVDLTADSSTAGQGYIIYKIAHLKTASGATIDAAELRANMKAATNAIQNVVATGSVRVHVEQIDQGRTYTVNADKAVFDPKSNRIDLTGNVKATITSGYTVGPLVQTGDSGFILLGKAPDYPIIEMDKVHVTFTPQQ